MNNKNLKVSFLILSCFLLSCSFYQAKDFSKVSLKNLKGHSFKQTEIIKNNQPILYFFIASWCPKCRNEIQSIEALYSNKRLQKLNILVVGIDDTIRDLALLKSTYHLTMPIYLDYGRDLQARFKLQSIPQTVLVSSDGKLLPILDINTGREVDVIKGARNWKSKLFQDWLAKTIED